MKKTLSLLLALTLVVSLFAAVGSASAASLTAGEQLKAIGVIKGDTTGSLNETSTWDKQDLAVLLSRLAGKEEVAAATAKSHTFADVADDYYDGYISWALANKYITGVSATEFGFNQPVSYKVLNAVILRVLGYDTTGANYDTTEDLAVSVGISEATDFDAVAVRGIAYGTILKALELNVKGTEKSLGLTLGIKSFVDAAAAKAAEAAAAAKPQVVSVTAINSKTIEVKFNAELASVTTGAFLFGAANPTAAVLGSDNKTATLTFTGSNAEQSGQTFSVASITTKADVAVTTLAYAAVFSYTDTVAPTIASVASSTNGATASAFTIEFSEPVQAGSAIKVNGSYVGQTTAGTSTTISGQSLAAGVTHKVEIVALKDQSVAQNSVSLTSKEFTVTVDTVKPVATVAAKNDKTITLTFNKSMNVASVTGAAIRVVDGTSLATVTTAAITGAVDGTDNKVFELTLSNDPFASVTSKSYFVQVPASIADSLGNVTDAANLTVTLSKDTVAPVATAFGTTKQADGKITALTITFSEDLAGSSAAAATTIIDNGGVLVTSANFPGGLGTGTISGNTVTYALTTPTALSGVYTFSYAAGLVADKSFAANSNAAFSFTKDFGAAAVTTTTTFAVSSVANTTSSTIQTIAVTFAEAVVGGAVANSATDVANYTINGSALPAGTTITLNAAKTVATIIIPAGAFGAADSAAVFTASGIKAASGNTLTTYVSTLAIVDTKAPVLVSARLLSSTEVELTYDSNVSVSGVTSASFVIAQDGTALAQSAITGSAVAGYSTKVRLTLATGVNGSSALTVKTAGTGVTDTATPANAQATDVTVTIAR